MKKLKKIVASLLAISSIALCMTGISANAYSPQADWNVYRRSSDNCNSPVSKVIYTYGGGYQTYCSSISGSNDRYVEVSASGMSSYRITTTGYSTKHTASSSSNTITFVFTASSPYCEATGTVGYYN